jgi:hypothetical protein
MNCDDEPGEFDGVWGEGIGVVRGLILSTLAVVVALSFNNFVDAFLQNIIPYQEKELKSIGQITLYRLLITMFLLMVLIATSILLSTHFSHYKQKASKTGAKKKKSQTQGQND